MNFLTTKDFTTAELNGLVDLAKSIKHSRGRGAKPLDGHSVALVFFNPSLRTRASMQIGIYELGGNPVLLEPGSSSWTLEHRTGAVMDADKTEHLAEFVGVLGRYVSTIGVRTFAALEDWESERGDPVLTAFEKYSPVPVINLESAMHHPCQAMADMMTIREKLGEGRKKVLLTWAWHPKALPMAVPNSFALASAQFGHDLTIAHPPGYELDEELRKDLETRSADAGGSVRYVSDAASGFDDAEVVYAKSWGAKNFYGDSDADITFRRELRADWIVDSEKMRRTSDGIFMHCLPVRRNVIVTDEVIDSRRSVVLDEAENRLHIQKAILTRMFESR